MLDDDNDVKIRHKKLLNKIRKDHPTYERSDGHSGTGNQEVRTLEQEYPRAERYIGLDQGERRGESRGTRGDPQRVDGSQGTGRGPDSGAGPLDTKDQH